MLFALREISIVHTKKIVLVVTLICVLSGLCLFASFSHVLATQSPGSSDWPMFHYDLNHDGYTLDSTGPMTNNTLWTHPLNGFVTSAPTVVNGVAYIGLGDGLYAFNAYTGSQIWRYQDPQLLYSPYNGGTYYTDYPAFYQCCVANGVIYTGSYDGSLYAIDASTGTKLWSFPTSGGAGYESPYAGDVGEAPCVVGNVVYFAAGNGYAYALNTATHAQIWSVEVPGSYVSGGIVTVTAPSSPTVVGGVLYIGSAGGALDAFDASSGALLWSYQTSGANGVSSTPAVVGGVVYFGSSDSNVYALAAGTTSSTSTSLLWSYPTGGAVRSSPAVANGVVYIGSVDGKVYALNAASGAKLWSYQTPMNPGNPGVGNWVDSSPAVANGVVYVGSENYDVYALNAASGALIWSYQTPYVEPSCPAIASGVLYIGGYGVFAFDGVSASISPTSQVMDVGQSQAFTLSASGGSGSLSYEWCLNGVATGQTGSTYTFSPAASNIGTNTIYANVTDNLGVTGESNTATITVNAAPSATVAPTSSAVDWHDGHWLTYTVTPSGGTGKLSYQWYVDNAQVGATGTTYQFLASYSSVGSHSVYCTVTDSATTPVTANSNTADFTVNPQLGVTVSPSAATTPTSVSVDPGQSATFTATPTGGSGTYTYQWYVNYAAQGSVTSSSTLSYSTTTPGQYYIGVEVFDGVSQNTFSSSSANLNVNSPPLATISPDTPTMDVGQQQLFYVATVQGGEGSYTYEWYLNGVDTQQSGTYFYYTAQASDVTNPPTITVVPTDSYGLAGQSNYVTPTVNPALTATVTPSSWTMNVGQLQTFLVSTSGGTGTATYEWYVNGVDSGMSGTTFDYTAQSSDVNSPPSIYAVATDTVNGQATSNTVTITVNPAENAGSTAGASAPVTSGSVTVDQSTSTGVAATVTGTSLQNGETLDVNSAYYGGNQPSGTGAVSVGGAVFFDVAVSQAGGAPLGSDVMVQVSFTDPSITSSSVIQYWDSSSWVQVTTTFTAPDTVSGSIPADDLTGTSIAVGSSSAAGPSVSVSPGTWNMDVGQKETFTATATGGTSPYSYEWYLNGQDTGKSGSTYTYTAQASDVSTPPSIYAVVTDSLDNTAQSNTADITVYSTLTAPTVTPSAGSVTQGNTSTLSATAVTTGSQSYTYQWYEEAPGASVYSLRTGAALSSYNFATTSSTAVGTWNFILQVTDSNGAAVNSTATTVTVNAPTSTPTPTPTPTGTTTPTSTPTPTPSPTQKPTASPSPSPTPTPTIPEFPSIIIAALVFLAATATTILYKKRHENTNPVAR